MKRELKRVIYYKKYLIVDPGKSDRKPVETLSEEEYFDVEKEY